MIIREYKRNLMVVKNIESDIISEAYFILKSGAEEEQEEKISAEAERIIKACGAGKKKRRTVSAAFICACVCFGVLALVGIGALLIAQLAV